MPIEEVIVHLLDREGIGFDELAFFLRYTPEEWQRVQDCFNLTATKCQAPVDISSFELDEEPVRMPKAESKAEVEDLLGDDSIRETVADLALGTAQEPPEDLEVALEGIHHYWHGDGATPDEMLKDTIAWVKNNFNRYPLLTPDEVIALSKRKDKGDQQARLQLIVCNLRLLMWWGRRYVGRGMEFLDLIQEGYFGLVRAVDLYDWRRGKKFSTYAGWWMKSTMDRAIKNQASTIRVPVNLGDRSYRVLNATRQLSKLGNGKPTLEEIGEIAHLSVSQVKNIVNNIFLITQVNNPYDTDDGADKKLGDRWFEQTFASRSPQPDLIAEARDEIQLLKDQRDRVADFLQVLPFRERRIAFLRVGLYNYQKRSLAYIGDTFGVTRERIRQLEARLDQLFFVHGLTQAAVYKMMKRIESLEALTDIF